MKTPLVSVILPTYNRCHYIEKALEGVLSQTYQNFEFIVVDDGSADATPEILLRYAKNDARVRILRNKENIGLPRSLNKGIAESQGIYIARIDDDDFWCDTQKLEKQVRFLERNSDCVLVGGGQIRIDAQGEILARSLPPEQDLQVRAKMLISNPFPHTSVLFRKKAWEIAGKYDEHLDFSEDWDLWMRFGSIGTYHNFQEYFITYLQDDQNRSNENRRTHAKLNLQLRTKYRAYFPNFWRGYFFGVCSYTLFFFPFKKVFRLPFLKLQKSQKSRKVKICQVASADISLRFLLLDFMRYLQKEGYEVYAACSDGKWVPEIRDAGIKVQTVAITRRLFTPIADLVALFRLYRFFRKERFDIVHTHTPKACFLGQLAAFFARVPVRIITIHGLYFQKDSSWQKKIIFVPIERIIARIVHKAFSVNREDVAFLVDRKIYPPGKVIYVGGGIDLQKFDPSRFSEDFILQKKRDIGISPNVRVIGIVARLVREKGFVPLFAAFAEILKRFPDVILLVIGPEEPEKRDALDKNIVDEYGIRDKVLFLGERTDVIELYSAMDVFVLPSYREGLGLSILEASAMKRPVVASDIRGCREGVDDKKTGLLVPSNNPAKLAEAIEYVLSHPEEAKAMGEEGRKKVEREYDQGAVFELLRKEYERLLQV